MDDPTVNRPVKISASQVPIRTDFGKDEARLKWSNRPSKLSYETDGLHVQPEAKTDWWRGTHYPNYDADNAHVLAAEFEGDFVMTTSATFTLTNRFDQASFAGLTCLGCPPFPRRSAATHFYACLQYGLVVRVSKDCWLKTSIEYDPPGPPKLGAVVTNMGFSDWSSQSCPQDISSCDLCVRREGPDLIVESRIPGQTDWEQVDFSMFAAGFVESMISAIESFMCRSGSRTCIRATRWYRQGSMPPRLLLLEDQERSDF